MKPQQTLWSLIFLLGPAIYIGIVYGFWNGILAFILTFILGALLGQISIRIIPFEYLITWAYIKPPLVVAFIVLGFHLLN